MSEGFAKELRELNFYTINKRSTSPGNNIAEGRWTAYFLKAEKHHPLFEFISEAWENYFSAYDALPDYFLIDHTINIGYLYISAVKEAVDAVPESNAGVFELSSRLNMPYDEQTERELFKHTYLHKLTYKRELIMQTETGALTFWGKMKKEWIDDEI